MRTVMALIVFASVQTGLLERGAHTPELETSAATLVGEPSTTVTQTTGFIGHWKAWLRPSSAASVSSTARFARDGSGCGFCQRLKDYPRYSCACDHVVWADPHAADVVISSDGGTYTVIVDGRLPLHTVQQDHSPGQGLV